MTLAVHNTGQVLGTVITGVDLGSDDSDQTFNAVKNALNERSVVVIKGQKIDPGHLSRFAQRFGELLVHEITLSKDGLSQYPAVSVLSNIVENGKLIGVPDAGMVWHTDGSYLECPDMYSFLYGIEIPVREGKALGNTLFVSTAAAYDALSESMKQKVAPLMAVHSLEYHSINRARNGGTKVEINDEFRKKAPDRQHPVVRIHPVTGRKCLYVNAGFTNRIVGMDETESADLLRALFEHLLRPEFLYSHSWEPGDLVLWDNAATQHRATADYALPLRRRMNRVATEGTKPY